MHLAAIVGLLLIVLVATLRPVNAGAIALVGTFAVGTFVAGEDIRTLYSGFPVDLFVLLFGVTYLFGIAFRRAGSRASCKGQEIKKGKKTATCLDQRSAATGSAWFCLI